MLLQDLKQHRGCRHARLVGIDVGCCVVGDHRINDLGRLGDDIGVHIQRDNDRHVGAKPLPQLAQQDVLAGVDPFGPHRAV